MTYIYLHVICAPYRLYGKVIAVCLTTAMCAGCQLLRWLSQTQVEDGDDYDDLEILVREEGIQVFGF